MRGDQNDPNLLQQRDEQDAAYAQAEPSGHSAEREHLTGEEG